MKLCANILGRNIYVRFKFSCVRPSHGLCVRAHAHSLEGTLSSVKFSLSVLVPQTTCAQSAQANNNSYELLNFIIQLDLISSFHDSVASPGNDVRGAQYKFSSPPLSGILFS